ncbi:DUF2975 family protein [Xylanimonas ulmi]|uniref:DUF2975 family protein n=2 Tax=Xylanimonas ulmi TaxID=228973 RepID=A0A4Q7M199_9MICO|nr:DUF2975 family protein [Xylanibacterium ulmi]
MVREQIEESRPVRRSAWISVTALHGLLLAATVWVLAFNLWGSLGPSYADVVRVPWNSPVASVQVVPGPGLGDRVAAVQADPAQQADQERHGGTGLNLFPWSDDSATGTTDAFTGRPPVEWGFADPRMTLWGPRGIDQASLAAPVFAWGVLALVVLWLLWRLVGSVATDDVFTRANVRRVALIGVLVAAGGSVLQLGEFWLDAGIVARSAANGILQATFSFSLMPLWVGFVFLTLAEVFRQGVLLRDDVAGLV